MKHCYLYVTAIFMLLIAPAAQAQQEESATAELLENFFRDNEGASESDAQIFLEALDNFRQNPLDLNKADRDDLLAIRLLNDLQVESFLEYRLKLGALLNIYELQAVPGWEVEDIRRILPFVKVGNGGLDERYAPLYEGFFKGENELIARWGRSDPIRTPSNSLGRPNAIGIRYRHTFDNRLRFGFTAEHDAGEPFGRVQNKRGFDFYSAHFFIQNPSNRRLRALALGDFTARLGQGLLLQTGFAPGKSAESIMVMRGGRKLNAYNAFGEVFFLRGGGATVGIGKHLEATVFASYRKRDANIATTQDTSDLDPNELIFTSLQNSGLHRTESELEDKGSLRETLVGASLSYQHRRGAIAVNGLHIQYNKPWQPSPAVYRLYTFKGSQLSSGSVDYRWQWRNYTFFGENAVSDNGGHAHLNGLIVAADRKASFLLLHRLFTPDYQAIYAAPFAETTGAVNEQGVYIGTEIRPSDTWKINAYADLWKHAWLRFGSSAPSTGHDYQMRVVWQPERGVQLYALWQSESKQRDGAEGEGLINTQRTRFRLHGTYKINRSLECRSRLEWMGFQIEKNPGSTGFLAFQEAVVKPMGKPFSMSFRYAIFDTDDFDTRVFAFENDVFSAVSIPAFAGRGSRFYCNLSWRITRALRLEGRYETTYYQRSVTSGTIPGRISVYKLLLRVKW